MARPPGRLVQEAEREQRKENFEIRSPHRTLWWSEAIEHEHAEGEKVIPVMGKDHKQKTDRKNAPKYRIPDAEIRSQVNASVANLISSRTVSGKHAPVLDIDFNARLVPSRTVGHFHLYLDKEMPWWKYRILLWAMAFTGIIEPGYYRASVRRRQTFCRWRIATHYLRNGDARDQALGKLLELRERINS